MRFSRAFDSPAHQFGHSAAALLALEVDGDDPLQQSCRIGLVNDAKALFAWLVFVNVGFFDVEIPAVQPQLARCEPLLHDGVGLEVLELLEHVEL
jgi:hypothetical protein